MPADAGIFVGFGFPVRGRERQAIQVFGETMAFWGRLQQEGEIESVEPVFLEPHGGDLGGFFLVRGEREALARVRVSDEFQRVVFRAGLIVESLGVVGANIGEAIEQSLSLYEQQLGELT